MVRQEAWRKDAMRTPKVYILQHTEPYEGSRMLGVYASRALAEAALRAEEVREPGDWWTDGLNIREMDLIGA